MADVHVPDSVREYINDGGVRRALIELRRIGSSGILDGLEWTDLGRFYRAQLAARQFESEWAIFAVQVWEQVWGGLLDRWTPLSPDEQDGGDFQAGLSLTSLLDTEDGSLWFGRVFRSGRWTFWATVSGIPSRGLAVKVACSSGTRTLKFPDVAPLADESGNWVSRTVSMDGEIEFKPLREAAASAASAAEGQRGRTKLHEGA